MARLIAITCLPRNRTVSHLVHRRKIWADRVDRTSSNYRRHFAKSGRRHLDREAYKKEIELETKRIEVIQMLTAKTSGFANRAKIAQGVDLLENALKEHAEDGTLVPQIKSLLLRLKTTRPFLKLKAGKVEEANAELATLFATLMTMNKHK